MFLILIAVVCLMSAHTQAAPKAYGVPTLGGRIVGGEPTFVEEIPYQVSLQTYSAHSCGGVVISENYVLTAAHCTIGFMASQLEVRVGTSFRDRGGILKQVAAVYQHPLFNHTLIDYDITILRLASPLSFGPTIAPVALPEFNQPIIAGSISRISGWGLLSQNASLASGAEQLQVTEVPLISLEECRAAYGVDSVTDRMVCGQFPGGGKEACKGDSGGPVVVNGTLIGLVSWSIGCARPDYPGVHASVPALRNYITFITGL